ncbi:unnamed protein product [marine sediment metagenome]|uniref:Uncharacterized protein n=1 Tax=marine sediment metagenome TaxID=412755 RepID=X1SHV6_9ZZZZ
MVQTLKTIPKSQGVCQAPLVEISHSPPEQQTLAHRNASLSIPPSNKKEREPGNSRELYSYGVPMKRKILTCELYNKRFDEIRHYLDRNMGLTLAEREGILRLLRIYAYYGRVYPKASQIADDFGNMIKGCSKRSFWRAIAKLREDGLVQVHNRFLHGRQISNCYRLDKLILCLVRWLLEHGSRYLDLLRLPRELFDALHIQDFWRLIWCAKADLSKAVPVQPGLNQEGGTP